MDYPIRHSGESPIMAQGQHKSQQPLFTHDNEKAVQEQRLVMPMTSGHYPLAAFQSDAKAPFRPSQDLDVQFTRHSWFVT
jgi:hypothetical protein